LNQEKSASTLVWSDKECVSLDEEHILVVYELILLDKESFPPEVSTGQDDAVVLSCLAARQDK
jgi:hypothetical protein